MEVIDSDISSVQPQCLNESELCQEPVKIGPDTCSKKQPLHYQHYLESDTIAYFICGYAMELSTLNFKLHQAYYL